MYGVWKETHFYQDFVFPGAIEHDDWVRDESGAVIAFETDDEAQKEAERRESEQWVGGRYYLRNGEYSSPDYEARPLRAADCGFVTKESKGCE